MTQLCPLFRRTLPDILLGDLYQVSPRQISRWRSKDIDPETPRILAEKIAAQERPGAVLQRLVKPGAIEEIETKILAARRISAAKKFSI